jgi:hypothetical protein
MQSLRCVAKGDVGYVEPRRAWATYRPVTSTTTNHAVRLMQYPLMAPLCVKWLVVPAHLGTRVPAPLDRARS